MSNLANDLVNVQPIPREAGLIFMVYLRTPYMGNGETVIDIRGTGVEDRDW